MLPLLQNLWITTIESFKQDEDGDGNENGKTAIALGQKTINMHVHHAFVHFSDVRARLGHETS